MSVQVVLLFEAERAAEERAAEENELSIAPELEKAGCEVVEAHSLSTAAALLFISHRFTAVVIDAPSSQIGEDVAHSLSALCPDLPVLVAAWDGVRQVHEDGRAVPNGAAVKSTLEEILSRRVHTPAFVASHPESVLENS